MTFTFTLSSWNNFPKKKIHPLSNCLLTVIIIWLSTADKNVNLRKCHYAVIEYARFFMYVRFHKEQSMFWYKRFRKLLFPALKLLKIWLPCTSDINSDDPFSILASLPYTLSNL